ncbi:MAG: 3-deoxy-D-manno-octulosonic acid transferase [Bacteroidetes bacterium 4572_77]|nr:MAG: 3-deoxy-D-manno-octulosonic acid transferase [Bacteroidetes bacterium 4572_77]
MRFIYTLFIILYSAIIRIAALFSKKAQLWTKGRKNLSKKMELDFSAPFSGKTIWMHSASLGEFEQGRPILEHLRKENPHLRVVLTFFSPSGYEVRKNEALADFVYYLPIDTKGNAQRFLKTIQISMAIFIKYEFWFNYLNELHKQQIPTFFVSAIFRPSQHFFKHTGKWQRSHLQNITHFFVQNQESARLLQSININQYSLSGDTRFDRVIAIAQQAKANPIVEAFANGNSLFLAGSSWPKEEKYLKVLQEEYPDMCFLIAPHLIHEEHIQEIEALFPSALRYSKASKENVLQTKILIVDTMGMLSSLYQYAHYAMIGGGFGAGIHNTLEAATFGMPIFIGPNYQKFQEAKDLIRQGVIQVFENDSQLIGKFKLLNTNNAEYQRIKNASGQYIQLNAGATLKILSKINEYL